MKSGGSARKPRPRRKVQQRPIIAIDGPAGSGKTTVAAGVARALGLSRLDTGAMYRALTLKALRNGIDPSDARSLAALTRQTSFEQDAKGLLVDGRRLSRAIRSPEVSRTVSEVSAHPGVRRELVRRQREIMERGGFVAEGRDIGTVVCPKADVKVFLTASASERAHRRHRELTRTGVRVSRGHLEKEQGRRDRIDSTRAISPLVPARDAHLIDSTGRTPVQVVGEIVGLAREAAREPRRR